MESDKQKEYQKQWDTTLFAETLPPPQSELLVDFFVLIRKQTKKFLTHQIVSLMPEELRLKEYKTMHKRQSYPKITQQKSKNLQISIKTQSINKMHKINNEIYNSF